MYGDRADRSFANSRTSARIAACPNATVCGFASQPIRLLPCRSTLALQHGLSGYIVQPADFNGIFSTTKASASRGLARPEQSNHATLLHVSATVE